MLKQAIFDQKNILVTGGAGFIGSFLCEELVKNAKVICVDNFISGTQQNIDHLLRLPNFIFLRHDLRTPLDVKQFPELERFKIEFQGIQEIYHLAAPTSPKDFEQYRIETLEAHSLVMKNVLDLARTTQAKFVHASSSVVYGARPEDGTPFLETSVGAVDPVSKRACYDEGKRFAETAIATYRDVYGLDAKIARIFRTYGPRMPLFHGHMIPDFITSALDGKNLVIFGDSTFRTSLVYVTDVVEALIKLMDAPPTIGPVNVGSDQDLFLVDVAERILALTGATGSIAYEPALLFMSQLGLPDLRKVKDELGWLPVVTLDEGLRKTVEYTKAEKGLVR